MALLLARLPAALSQVVSLRAHSSLELCAAITRTEQYNQRGAPGAPPPKRPKPLAPLARTAQVELRPIDLLLTLGLAMLPPRHVQENLASWHWSLLRFGYLVGSVAAAGDPFASNELAADYRYHNMTGLSEAIGVGCALSYATAWLRDRLPAQASLQLPLDLEYLLDGAPLRLPGAPAPIRSRRAPHASRRPDYLIVAEQDGRVRLMVVECKGSSGSRTKAVGQLGSAMHQLAAIVFTGGSTRVKTDRHAYAARLSRQGGPIELYGADPDDDGEPWIELAEPDPDAELQVADLQVAELHPAGHLIIAAPGAFAAHVILRARQRIAAWTGASETFERLDPEPLMARESAYGPLVGATSSFLLPAGPRVEVFTGALRDALTAAADSENLAGLARRQAIRRQLMETDARFALTGRASLDDGEGERVASVITDDGLVLSIEVT